MLNMLAERGYKPLVVVSDGHGGILSAIKDWNIAHQRCVFHLLKNLRDTLTIKRELKGSSRVLFVRMRRILHSKTIEELSERANDLRRVVFCFRKKEQQRALQWFWETLHEATLHLSFDGEVPRTSNVIERLNGQIKARLKTMRGVKSKKSLQKLLKILFYFRNYK
jgi:transposase-like protein